MLAASVICTPFIDKIISLFTLFDTFDIQFSFKTLLVIANTHNKNLNHVNWSKLHVNWLQDSRKVVGYARELVNYKAEESISTYLQSRKILISKTLKTNTREIHAS